MTDVRLGPFTVGMNNRQPNHSLPEGTLRNAVNTKIDSSGVVSRRDGMVKVYDGIECKDGWSCPMGVFFRMGSSVYYLNDENTVVLLFDGVHGDSCAYEYLNNIVYFSDGLITKKIDSSFSVSEWGIERPVTPVVYGTSGIYGGGIYLCAITFVNGDGLESGASDIVSVSVDDNSGLVIGNIPTTTDPQVSGVRLYLSTANGSVLYQIAEVAVGTVSYAQLMGNYDEGKALETEFVYKPPPGRIIKAFHGQLYIADDQGNVWYTNPLSYDQIHITDNWLQFSSAIDVMEPVIDGVWFAYGDQTDFYFGNSPEEFSPKKIIEYGAVFGTSVKIGNSNNVAWYSDRGMVVAAGSGEYNNIQEENVATDTATSGATAVKEEDGIRQFITSLSDPTVSKLAARDFINAEIIRKS